jgi:hypothetical protein
LGDPGAGLELTGVWRMIPVARKSHTIKRITTIARVPQTILPKFSFLSGFPGSSGFPESFLFKA